MTMPKINLPPRKPKTTTHSDTEMRALRMKGYNSTAWKKARAYHITQHPICEDCLKEGVVYAGGDEEKGPISVHHLRSPFIGGKINWDTLVAPDNLVTLCAFHHGLRHAEEGGKPSPEKLLACLDALLLNDDWDEDTGSDK